MIAFLKRYLARRRLRPVVGVLPRHLVKSFGASDYCTSGQAKRAIADLRLPKSLEPYAYAAVCRHAEIEKAGMAMSVDRYHALRAELEDLFRLARPDFTIADLLYAPHNPSNPPAENDYASGGTPSHH